VSFKDLSGMLNLKNYESFHFRTGVILVKIAIEAKARLLDPLKEIRMWKGF
jgi:hypothetical protein